MASAYGVGGERGRAESVSYGDATASRAVLIVYDPDPIYDLDKQICIAFAETLMANGIYCRVSTVAAASVKDDKRFDVYLFCANTYNWRPDWAITRFIQNLPTLQSKKVIAVTVGAGSTEASQAKLESIVINRGATLLESRYFWVLKPNDESRLNEPNVEVAKSIARNTAQALVGHL